MRKSHHQRSKEKRHLKTLEFVKKHLDPSCNILDLGTPNSLSELLKNNGYTIQNTKGENLDTQYHSYADNYTDTVTAFEIFEHLLAPFNFLKASKAQKMVASVPLKLWFASAYWHKTDPWDRHYHEFEIKQFNFLLEQTGWQIKASELWTSSDWRKIGIRPLLRHFTPRYYIVYCERI